MDIALVIGNSSLRLAAFDASGLTRSVYASWEAGETPDFASAWASVTVSDGAVSDDAVSDRTVSDRTVSDGTLSEGGSSGTVSQVICSTVRPDRWEALQREIRAIHPDVACHVAGVDVSIPLRCACREPRAVGMDRQLSALAVHRRWPDTDAAAIDFGTATSVTVVSPGGVLRGGLIAPGLGVIRSGFEHATPRLPRLDRAEPQPGATQPATLDAMRSGTFAFLLGGAQRMIDQLHREYPNGLRIALTGAIAPRLAPKLRGFDAVDPDLGLRGLHAAWCSSLLEGTSDG